MEVGGDRGLCIFQRVWSRNQEPEPRTVELGPIHNVLGKKSSQGWVKWSEHSASPSNRSPTGAKRNRAELQFPRDRKGQERGAKKGKDH
jgi:hypothetical protein